MNKRESHYSTEALFKGLKALLNSLPSEEEKTELIRTLNEAQSFLDEVRLLVEAVPTMESSRELSEGLSRLDILVERANRDTGLRKLLGLRGSTASGARRVPGPDDSDSRALNLKQELTQLDTSEVKTFLEQLREPLSVLTKLANLLGMRTRSKERKADLIQRMATHIENQRGYRLLRTGGVDADKDDFLEHNEKLRETLPV